MKHIVLAHGILGFGSGGLLPIFVQYFNGVAAHLGKQGHRVIEPQVNPIGSIKERGNRLGAIVMETPLEAGAKWHIIAHSMGGLDARHALAHVPGFKDRVATLVTIGTPHGGSPVADELVKGSGPLFDAFPRVFSEPLLNTEGLRDLMTTSADAFNAETPHVDGPRYIAIAGDARRADHELLLFKVAAALGDLPQHEINDGVVTKSSAMRERYEPFADWPTDHAGEIGWTVPPVPASALGLIRRLFFRAPPHFARYDDLVSRL